MKNLCCQGELLKACLSMSHAQSVLITTGFPTHFQYEPPEENDGPPGAIAMAAMLKAMGKNVAIVTDQRALNLNQEIIKEAVEQGKMLFYVDKHYCLLFFITYLLIFKTLFLLSM